jgi:hypothetical protein
VRKLRVDGDNTWRGVALECSTAWHTDWGEDQIAGMVLCQLTAAYFGEDWRRVPWN